MFMFLLGTCACLMCVRSIHTFSEINFVKKKTSQLRLYYLDHAQNWKWAGRKTGEREKIRFQTRHANAFCLGFSEIHFLVLLLIHWDEGKKVNEAIFRPSFLDGK